MFKFKIILSVDYDIGGKVWTLQVYNQNFKKVTKILSYGIKEHVLKTLGASIIYSSMSSPFLETL